MNFTQLNEYQNEINYRCQCSIWFNYFIYLVNNFDQKVYNSIHISDYLFIIIL
jgi:hypothetical protein